MARFIYIASLLLIIALCQVSTSDDDSSESDSDAVQSSKDSQTTEGKAGEAIKTLLQEKITQKFKEAANEVKGVLVKQLGSSFRLPPSSGISGDSLKSAHDAFNPPKELKKLGANAKATGDSKPSGTYRLKTGRKMQGQSGDAETYEADAAQTLGTENYTH